MTRVLLLLSAFLLPLLSTTAQSSAQANSDIAEYCLEHHGDPACRAFKEQYCAADPTFPACMSDEDDYDD